MQTSPIFAAHTRTRWGQPIFLTRSPFHCRFTSMSNPHPLPSPATQFATGKPKPHKPHVTQILNMQDVLYADATDKEATRRERAYSACAWERLDERLRIRRMIPKPKDVDVAKAKEDEEKRRRQCRLVEFEPVYDSSEPRSV